MKLPLQVTFRHMEPSDALDADIREHAEILDKFAGNIMSCRVVVEAPHQHKASCIKSELTSRCQDMKLTSRVAGIYTTLMRTLMSQYVMLSMQHSASYKTWQGFDAGM